MKIILYLWSIYRIWSSLVLPKLPTLSQICEEEIDNGDFYFSKKFTTFFTKKRATGGLFDYYGIVSKKINKIKIRRSSSQ